MMKLGGTAIAFRVLLLVIGTSNLLLVLGQQEVQLPPLDPTKLLNEAPFVFAHNAATGYLQIPSDFSGALEGYTKNQDGTFTDLLNCGARALDLEFITDGVGDVVFGHGDVVIPEIGLDVGLQEIADWTRDVAAPEELILLSIDACDGCLGAVTTILESLGIQLISDCSILNGLTVAAALELGPIVAIVKDCFVQNFDGGLSCRGFLPSSNPANVEAVRACIPDLDGVVDLETTALIGLLSEAFSCLLLTLDLDLVDVFDCWTTSDTFDYPRTQLLNYLETTASSGPPGNGLLWQIQGLWQASEDSILLGLFRPLPLPATLLQLVPSNLLQDLELSEVNRLVLDFVSEQVGNNVPLNLVEVDHVCDEYGKQLLPTLRSTRGAETTEAPNATTVPTTTLPNSTEATTTLPVTNVTSTVPPPSTTAATTNTTVLPTTTEDAATTSAPPNTTTTTVPPTTPASTTTTTTTTTSTLPTTPPTTPSSTEPPTTIEPSTTPLPTTESTSGGSRLGFAMTLLVIAITSVSMLSLIS